jgi:hypothetical protein
MGKVIFRIWPIGGITKKIKYWKHISMCFLK